eukprot:TRINITY_DN398_c0_g1_i1.p2 TRINITY_DN398_c0_g1~~TRINITY_DN398_c0_g1_i1.p2  ORF type:complete len:151 (-),score=40.23 TRINITY_DN398_c0_g1_i1:869-1321(-)
MAALPAHKVVSEDLFTGAQPSVEELDQWKDRVKTIVNLRPEGEEGFDKDEQKNVESRGLHYVHIPVKSPVDIKGELADDIASKLKDVPKPVFIHCKVGGRATTAALFADAINNNKSADDVYKKQEALGFKLPNPEMEAQVKQNVADRFSK